MLDKILASRAGLQSTNDFSKYHKRATRKVAKLRRRLDLVQRPQKGQASPPKPLVDAAHSVVALWLAERAWAAGMGLRSALEATDSPLLKRQMLSKLAKARKYANRAAALDDASSHTELGRLEILLYDTMVSMDLAVQQKNWDAVVELGSAARVGCDVMAKKTNEPLFGDVVAATIDPALRFAAQRTGRVKADVQRLAASVADSQTSPLVAEIRRVDAKALQVDAVAPVEQLGVIRWRHHEAHVVNADLAQAILQARSKTSSLPTPRDAANYDDVLLAWQEASDAAHDLISAAEAKNTNSDEASQSLYIVATYIDYTVLVNRIERDMLIIEGTEPTLTGLRDSVRIYDSILQSCEQLLELPGVYNDDELSTSLESLKAYFASRRCETVARGYAAVDNHAAALALVVRAKSLVADSISVDELPVSASQVEKWRSQLDGLVTKRHGLAALLAGGSSQGFVSDNIGVHPVGPPEKVLSRLANLEGRLQPVPAKPVFYDMAFNYLDVEDDEHYEPAAPAPKKLFGLF
ncbi:Signal recognition particle subunit SRP68 [Wickerhamiella sorbophila]|uniref:Signal recognition particle subunit SRP68 n=1 Tax=Wickerhamiella sorbophila TaxID=45607 RepID=A0A2T0FK71_9ASCO|nr:Signal recognition particle subunit SRP68 [Wickerhamiella sorbophila]PRT55378.1 Signal recognition particle subunit SRP68 [Wickerhamiella sorbophila]